MTAEEAHELIDELKNDLKVKEMEFDEMKAKFAKLEAENARLREEFLNERNSRLVIEGKLKKTAIHSELKEATEDITNNIFFEKKRSKLSSLNSTLLSSVTFICISLNKYRSTSNTKRARKTHMWPSTLRGGYK